MKKLLLVLLFVPFLSFSQVSDKKISKISKKTTFSSTSILKGSTVFIGTFRTKNRDFDKSNLGSHIKKNLIDLGFKPNLDKNKSEYIIEGNYVTDAIAKKQILGLWISMSDKKGNVVLTWQFERKFSGIILKPQEIGEYLKYIIRKNLSEDLPKNKGENLKTEKVINSNNTDKERAIEEIKRLKELLDMEIISQEEYDKKAESLKKIILKN